MDVEDRLPCVRVAVEDGAVAACRRTPWFSRDRRGAADHLADQVVVFRAELVERGDVPPRDDQHVESAPAD